jgi:hypothetical protein
MLYKKLLFLIFCTVFVVCGALAQQKPLFRPSLLAAKPSTAKGFILLPAKWHPQPAKAPLPPVPLVPPSFSTHNWGFFCRQELKFEKTFKIPFRFRLGSVQQCDRLEGKKGAIQ